MEDYIIEKRDRARIEKLLKLTDKATFWESVRKLTKNITSCRSLRRWQILAEARYDQLQKADTLKLARQLYWHDKDN